MPSVTKASRHARKKDTALSTPLPRITRLMALAIYFDELIRTGQVENYAELSKIGRVSRPRVTQIMDLLNLSPAVQERLLSLEWGRDAGTEHRLRGALRDGSWSEQIHRCQQ